VLLRDFAGVAMVDGYSVYETLARAGPGMSLANCWSHSRRRYVEIEQFYPEDCKKILDLIGKLYEIERLAPPLAGLQGAARDSALEIRAALRRERPGRWWARSSRGWPSCASYPEVRCARPWNT
jgi:hypothetical protein